MDRPAFPAENVRTPVSEPEYFASPNRADDGCHRGDRSKSEKHKFRGRKGFRRRCPVQLARGYCVQARHRVMKGFVAAQEGRDRSAESPPAPFTAGDSLPGGHATCWRANHEGLCPMSFFEYQCNRCGRIHPISPSQAGAVLGCLCGNQMDLPSLSDLRKHAGMTAYEKPTAEMIVEMVADGRLPDSPVCVNCSGRCDGQALVAICERTRTKTCGTGGGGSDGFVAGLILGVPFFLPLGGSGASGDVHQEQLGRDVFVPVPIRVCDRCWDEIIGLRANLLLRTGTRALGIVAAVLFLLWFAEPFLRFGVPLTWAISCFGVAVVLWITRSWYRSRSAVAVKSLLRTTPIYCHLLEEYPEAEIVAGYLHDRESVSLQGR